MFNFVLYPTKFENIVVKNAREYLLEPALVYAVIKTESNFDEKAKSKSNALGLMQILPTTADWIAKELNVSFNESDLFVPEVNVRFGCFYLKYLYDKFGDTDVVVAAYNAGTINNCLVTNCTITTTDESGGLCYVGGIVGYDNSGKINNVAFINTEDDVVFNINSDRCYLGGIAGESYATNITNAYVYQKDKDADRYGGILGVAEALEGGWTGRDVPSYFTNCVNCFAPSIIYAYGQSVKPLVNESNVFTFSSALTDLTVLPSEMSNWTYLSDLDCYVPCSNFE